MHRTLISLFLLLLMTSIVHADLRNGLVGWWRMDETSGNAIDWSGQNNTGTPTGTTIVKNCKRSGCRQFNGSSDYISIPYTNLNFERTDTFSISAWYNFNNVAPSGGLSSIIGRGTGPAGTFFGWCKIAVGSNCNANSIAFGLWGTTTTLSVSTATSSVFPSLWTHVVATYSGSSNPAGIKIYVNNVNMALTTFLNTLTTTIKPNINWRIGDDGTNDWASGQIDDVRIYNRVLTAQEVSDLYRSGAVIRNAVIRNARINQ